MCQPRKWWWGILPLAALWIGALALLTPVIESELTHRVKTEVAVRAAWAKLAVEGRDIVVQGGAPSEESQKQVMRDVLNVVGVRLVDNASALIPEAKPFTWGATRDASKVTLSGHIAADGTREMIVAVARKAMPVLTVADEMQDARGAPPGSLSMAAAALGQLAKLKTGSVALSDNMLSIKGIAADQAAAATATAAAKQLPKPLQLASVEIGAPAPPPPAPKASAIPTERPYVWRGVKDGGILTLTGAVPSDAARTQIVAAAKIAVGNGRVVDQLKIASGLPSGVDYGVATGFAANQLAQLRTGTAKLTDANLSIEGEALDAVAFRAVTAATAGALPGGIKLDRVSLMPPRVTNYVWSAQRDAKALTLSGHYPDEITHQTMLAAVQQRFPDVTLQDNTTIASGAPAGFAPAMAMGLDQLARLRSGEASIDAGRLTLSGVAASESIATEAKVALAKLVGGMPAVARLTFLAPPPPPPAPVDAAPAPAAGAPAAAPSAPVAPPAPAPLAVAPTPPIQVPPKPSPEVVPACTAGLAASAKSGPILFQSSQAIVLPASQPVIKSIASAMRRCPAMKIEIAGHTDSTGTPGFNETLSKDRAEAIRALLVKAGLEPARVKAAGYGSSRPVADNVTPAGKAKNRRIEFNVVE